MPSARPLIRRQNCSACRIRAARRWKPSPPRAIHNVLICRAPCCAGKAAIFLSPVAQLVAAYGSGALPRQLVADIAASFQAAVADIMADRLAHALTMLPEANAVIIAGGVAANQALRTRLAIVTGERGKPLIAPPQRLCTDNAVMVAWAGIERLRLGLTDPLSTPCRPRWPLDTL
jgi:tRNA A37 threonylcarbamoyltransferase TsaD